jgi:hypothetical protein
MRKTMLAVAAAIALGTASIATGAVAAPHGGGGHVGHIGGGLHGGGYRGGWHGGWGGLYAYGGPWYGDGCWVRRLVPTPFGLRWRLVNVCC